MIQGVVNRVSLREIRSMEDRMMKKTIMLLLTVTVTLFSSSAQAEDTLDRVIDLVTPESSGATRKTQKDAVKFVIDPRTGKSEKHMNNMMENAREAVGGEKGGSQSPNSLKTPSSLDGNAAASDAFEIHSKERDNWRSRTGYSVFYKYTCNSDPSLMMSAHERHLNGKQGFSIIVNNIIAEKRGKNRSTQWFTHPDMHGDSDRGATFDRTMTVNKAFNISCNK